MRLGFRAAYSREPARGFAREPPGAEAGSAGAPAQDETVSNGEGQPHVLPLHLGDVPGSGAPCLPRAHDGMRWDDEGCLWR